VSKRSKHVVWNFVIKLYFVIVTLWFYGVSNQHEQRRQPVVLREGPQRTKNRDVVHCWMSTIKSCTHVGMVIVRAAGSAATHAVRWSSHALCFRSIECAVQLVSWREKRSWPKGGWSMAECATLSRRGRCSLAASLLKPVFWSSHHPWDPNIRDITHSEVQLLDLTRLPVSTIRTSDIRSGYLEISCTSNSTLSTSGHVSQWLSIYSTEILWPILDLRFGAIPQRLVFRLARERSWTSDIRSGVLVSCTSNRTFSTSGVYECKLVIKIPQWHVKSLVVTCQTCLENEWRHKSNTDEVFTLQFHNAQPTRTSVRQSRRTLVGGKTYKWENLQVGKSGSSFPIEADLTSQ
jgi:hypothetical protein